MIILKQSFDFVRFLANIYFMDDILQMTNKMYVYHWVYSIGNMFENELECTGIERGYYYGLTHFEFYTHLNIWNYRDQTQVKIRHINMVFQTGLEYKSTGLDRNIGDKKLMCLN